MNDPAETLPLSRHLRRAVGKVLSVRALARLSQRARSELNYLVFPQSRDIRVFGDYAIPSLADPVCQLCTSEQIKEPSYERWCRDIGFPIAPVRKQWEFAYILQALSTAGMLEPGKTGLGFGCGREPLPGVFARHGCKVLATDQDSEQAEASGWSSTRQYAAGLDELYAASRNIVPKPVFDANVDFAIADMNAIPSEFNGQYDFVWSACALEHLGSLRSGLDFIRGSLDCLKPGGVAVHATEFNLSSETVTMETEVCSIFRARDIRALLDALGREGFQCRPLNLHTGTGRLDRFVDLPPYRFAPHLRLRLYGYVVTSIGLMIVKPA